MQILQHETSQINTSCHLNNTHIPKLPFLLLKLLREDRDLTGWNYSERPLSELRARFGKNEKTIGDAYLYLEELGFVVNLKGKGRGHVTKRMITEKGYLWLVDKTSDVITDVSEAHTIYRSLDQREENKEILQQAALEPIEEVREELISELKLTEHRLELIKMSERDKSIVIGTAMRSGISVQTLCDLTGRAYKAHTKKPIVSKRAYFIKAIQAEQSRIGGYYE